ncbi:uncharacterized protein PITG_12464 [Phytophthora infestans T30-4]|uniref:Uncharacterized protein n=2 Tax=Phytophthora infestans TaxID=4787 RepID=D0NKK7_PHYIT|nr:uncharacterized protein PITG_12464 [Phytophthora infestans T30-4]EEY60143.1 hypothetical protein PITG_12464 [Phytophthora infestans T30-4]|eukprot:XP_002900350.1 hypothetical protein PITG_12464 [Phytophthora infestans T30-4]
MPDFTRRSELLEARKQDRRALGLAIEPPLSSEKKYVRSERSYRDSYHPSGALAHSPRQQELDPSPQYYHPRATCSGSPTKTALAARRHHDTHLESLKFEPSEIERLRDIPKADKLDRWWKQPPGYVEDPAFFKDSLRLQLTRHCNELGPVDPAKVSSPLSVDERRRLREKRGTLADKVTHITHQMPEDSARIDSDPATAPDVQPQGQVRVLTKMFLAFIILNFCICHGSASEQNFSDTADVSDQSSCEETEGSAESS